MSSNEMALAVSARPEITFTDEQKGLLKSMVCPADTTDTELEFFLSYAKRTGLDPFARQIYCTKTKAKGFTVETTIDGFRLSAERTNEYCGQEDAQWCDESGVWVDVWLKPYPPRAARCGVYRKGFQQPLRAIALWDAYKQERWDYETKQRVLNTQWEKNGANMLHKCAEALALRKAFPRELSGIYTKEEMGQAENPPAIHEERGHIYRTEWNGIQIGVEDHTFEKHSHDYCPGCKKMWDAMPQEERISFLPAVNIVPVQPTAQQVKPDTKIAKYLATMDEVRNQNHKVFDSELAAMGYSSVLDIPDEKRKGAYKRLKLTIDYASRKYAAIEPEQVAPAPVTSKPSGRVISEKQVKRFHAIAASSGWKEHEKKALLSRYGFSSSEEITFGKVYNDICAELENGSPTEHDQGPAITEDPFTASDQDLPENLFNEPLEQQRHDDDIPF